MAGQWHKTANRGFFYGPSSNNAWNNDRGWVDAVGREYRQANRFAEQHPADQPYKSAIAEIDKNSERASTYVTSSSRDSLYKHFDKLSKEEQVVVLQDALKRKERLDKLEKDSDRFSEGALKGLSNKEKAERLIKALSSERERRIQKESVFVEMLNEERAARKQAEENMRALEQKLDTLASAMKGKGSPIRTKLPVLMSPKKQ